MLNYQRVTNVVQHPTSNVQWTNGLSSISYNLHLRLPEKMHQYPINPLIFFRERLIIIIFPQKWPWKPWKMAKFSWMSLVTSCHIPHFQIHHRGVTTCRTNPGTAFGDRTTSPSSPSEQTWSTAPCCPPRPQRPCCRVDVEPLASRIRGSWVIGCHRHRSF